ncbi:MAG: MarR family winged helix-turn-helix transcriptional regulator [Microbacterium sp.]
MEDLHQIFNDLIRFETEVWDAVDRRLRTDLQLPLSWFEPMQVIRRVERCRASDVARELSITEGGTSKLVARIEAAGYCEREADPDDRRASFISLTAAGEAALEAASLSYADELELWFRGAVSAAELRQFASTLAMLRMRRPARSREVPAP